jgi:hypothetical protein
MRPIVNFVTNCRKKKLFMHELQVSSLLIRKPGLMNEDRRRDNSKAAMNSEDGEKYLTTHNLWPSQVPRRKGTIMPRCLR